MAHNYEVGTRAWQPDPTEGWVASEVKEKLVDGDKVKLVFLLENEEVCLSKASASKMRRSSSVLFNMLTNIYFASQKLLRLPRLSCRRTIIQDCPR